jgi:peptidoglycan/LPS O-acetylase OafA/YrhL
VKGSWSLCTEEQFYIITPLLLILGAPWVGSVVGFRKFLIALLLVEPVVRLLSWWFLTGSLSRHSPDLFVVTLYQRLHTHADTLLMGLLVSNFEATNKGARERGLLGTGWILPLAVLAAIALRSIQLEAFNFTGVALVFGALVWFLLGRQRKWLRWLDSIVFYWGSRLSYGMYLNHAYLRDAIMEPCFNYLPFQDRLPLLHNLLIISAVTLLSVSASIVTFCLIEHPFLHLRTLILNRKAVRVAPALEGGMAAVAAP